MAMKGGAWAKDKISQGLDRRAARTVEKGRKNGGNFKSAKEQQRYMKAEEQVVAQRQASSVYELYNGGRFYALR